MGIFLSKPVSQNQDHQKSLTWIPPLRDFLPDVTVDWVRFGQASQEEGFSDELARNITKFIRATDEARLQHDPAYYYFIPDHLRLNGLEMPEPLPIQGVGWACLLRSFEENERELNIWEITCRLRRERKDVYPPKVETEPVEGVPERPQVPFWDAFQAAAKNCRMSFSEVRWEIEAFAERYHTPYSLRSIDELYDDNEFFELAVRLDRDRQYVRRHMMKGTSEQRDSAKRMDRIIDIVRMRFF